VTLSACLAGLAPGCLIADPPEYGGPQKTPPYIESSSISPTPYAIIDVFENDPTQSFAFKVYSEDAGDRLWTVFYRDYYLATVPQRLDDRSHAPSTLDVPHNITIPLTLTQVPMGCHSLTLLVMHESTWNNATVSPDSTKAITDMASVTWWMNVQPDEDHPNTLFDCPTREQAGGLSP